jgi:predicted Mrr-cat superfamily restriction endonuclease
MDNNISVRVRHNKNRAISGLILSFRSRKRRNKKHQLVQSNMFDEKVVSLEFMGNHFSVMQGENENREMVFYVTRLNG